MGTENLSYAWYDYPEMMHEMMEFYADLIIEVSKPVLEQVDVEYFTLNEDLSMKNGPLLSPDTFREFIFPHLKRLVEFMKSHGVRYFALDTDGNPTVLVPLFMDAGVDVLWPLERASDVHPVDIRKQFGPSLRMWGGVDKRVLPLGKAAINAHLRELIPLIEEGGYIPTIDHTVPPDVSWDNFRYYMDAKMALLAGEFGKLE
jgi:uroporphyrinogen decarboxylase